MVGTAAAQKIESSAVKHERFLQQSYTQMEAQGVWSGVRNATYRFAAARATVRLYLMEVSDAASRSGSVAMVD